MKSGDEDARELLIKSILRFVVSTARKFQGQGLELEDLVSAGNFGLVRACESFDPERGTRFITYAVWYIWMSMQKAISRGNIVSIPTNKVHKRHKIYQLEKSMKQRSERIPSDEEIASAIRVSTEEVDHLRNSRGYVSLDEPVKNHQGSDKGDRFIDLLAGNEKKPLESIFQEELSKEILNVLKKIPKREEEILKMRFGINGEQMTLQEVGNKIGISRERVRQLEKKAKDRLKHCLELNQLKDMVS